MPFGFKNGMNPSKINTNAIAVKRSEKLMSNNYDYHLTYMTINVILIY